MDLLDRMRRQLLELTLHYRSMSSLKAGEIPLDSRNHKEKNKVPPKKCQVL